MSDDEKISAQLVKDDMLRLFRNVKSTWGENAQIRSFDDVMVNDLGIGDGAGTGIGITIGLRGELTKQNAKAAALVWRKIRQQYPKAMIVLNIAGYDDDPRELHEFPDVRRYVCRWARYAGVNSLDEIERLLASGNMEHVSTGLLAACGALGAALGEQLRAVAFAHKPN